MLLKYFENVVLNFMKSWEIYASFFCRLEFLAFHLQRKSLVDLFLWTWFLKFLFQRRKLNVGSDLFLAPHFIVLFTSYSATDLLRFFPTTATMLLSMIKWLIEKDGFLKSRLFEEVEQRNISYMIQAVLIFQDAYTG